MDSPRIHIQNAFIDISDCVIQDHVQNAMLWSINLVTVVKQSKLSKRSTGKIEPRSEKTGLRGFRPGPTQTGLYNHRRWLEA